MVTVKVKHTGDEGPPSVTVSHSTGDSIHLLICGGGVNAQESLLGGL